MKLTRTNSTGYWPDDLPSPSANPGTIEIHYVQCGCTIQETPADAPFAFYGDVVSWSPTHQHHHNGTSDAGTPPRSASPGPLDEARSTSSEPPVRHIVDSGFCEKATCGRSKVFNREWNRLWEEHNSEMKEALDDQVAFEAFKARIRQEAKEATDGLLGRMTNVSA